MSVSNCAVIVDNRLSEDELSKTIESHIKFLPGWGVVALRPSHIQTPPDRDWETDII